jgi:hypothetical protein
MLFADPLGTLTLQLPTGWAMDIGSSAGIGVCSRPVLAT